MTEAPTDIERLLRSLFTKRTEYRDQREYRFVIWAEEEPSEQTADLEVSAGMLESIRMCHVAPSVKTAIPAREVAHGSEQAAIVEQRAPAALLPAPETPLLTTQLAVTDTADSGRQEPACSLLDLVGNPSVTHVPHSYDAADPPADLEASVRIYAALRTLRQLVDEKDNDPLAASAAWHAEPYIRRLCASFEAPIAGTRLTDDNFIVIEIKFPDTSEGYGKIAIGPRGTARIKIGRGREYTDRTSRSNSIWEWPMLDNLEATLKEYGMPTRLPDGHPAAIWEGRGIVGQQGLLTVGQGRACEGDGALLAAREVLED